MKYPGGIMVGAPEVVQLNMNMMRAIRARKVLDVGTFTGFSAVGAALALEPGGHVIAMDVTDQYWNEVGRKYAQEVANFFFQFIITFLHHLSLLFHHYCISHYCTSHYFISHLSLLHIHFKLE